MSNPAAIHLLRQCSVCRVFYDGELLLPLAEPPAADVVAEAAKAMRISHGYCRGCGFLAKRQVERDVRELKRRHAWRRNEEDDEPVGIERGLPPDN